MQYIVTKQIAVEANDPEDAVMKAKTEGKVMSLSVNLRPTPQQQQAVAQGGARQRLEEKREGK